MSPKARLLGASRAEVVYRLTSCAACICAVSLPVPTMQLFSARRCARFSDGALSELLSRGGLRHVCLSGVVQAGPLAARALAGCCRESLEVLDVSFCRWASSGGSGERERGRTRWKGGHGVRARGNPLKEC